MDRSALGPRAELVARAGAIPTRGAALVRAPAGSGKSSLLAAWERALRAAGWVATGQELGRPHADFSFWLMELAESLEDRLEGFGGQTRRRLRQLPSAEVDWPLLLRSFLRDWPRRPPRVALLVDGLEKLPAAGGALRLLGELALRPPPGLALVLATRGRAPAALARLRMEGRLLEVGPEDLGLRSSEVAVILASEGVEPEPELVARVLAATEGWAAGVCLLARHLAAAAPAERRDRVRDLARHEDLVAYLSAELLEGQPPEVLQLLQAAALVGRARPGELAVLAGPSLDLPSALGAAVDAGLLVPRGGEFAVPELWRTALGARRFASARALPARTAAEEVAGSLAGRGRVEEAVSLLLGVGAESSAADLLAAGGGDVLGRGGSSRVRALLERMPEELRERRPDLLQLEGVSLVGLNPDLAEVRLRRAFHLSRAEGSEKEARAALAALLFLYVTRGRLQDGRRLIRERFRPQVLVRDREARGGLLVWLAVRAVLGGRYGRARRLAERASRTPLGALERWAAATVRATVHHLSGEFDRSEEILRPVLRDPELVANGVLYQALRLQSAMAAGARGDAARAIAEVEEAVETLGALQAHQLEPAAWMARGRVHAAAGGLREAVRSFERAVAVARAHGNPGAEAQALAELAFAHHREGEPARTRDAARAALEAYRRCFASGDELFPWWHRYACWLLGRIGEPDEALRMLRQHGRRTLPRELPLVQHIGLLLEADLARLAGRVDEARNLARRGWSLAIDLGTRVADVAVLRELAVPTVGLAAEAGLDPLRLGPRLAALGAERVTASAAALLEAPRAAVRLAGVRLARQAPVSPSLRARVAGLARSDRSRAVREEAAALLPLLGEGKPERIELRTLGGFAVRRSDSDGDAVVRAGGTPLRLLARLLVAGPRGLSRERLAEDLWPDAEPAPARNRLRVAASRLNDLLEPDRVGGTPPRYLVASGDRLELVLGESLVWDATLFESEYDGFRRALADDDREAARRHGLAAAGLFGGPLLPELSDEPWLLPARRHLEGRFEDLTGGLGPLLVEAGDAVAAEEIAERARSLDPASETACRVLVTARLARGDRGGARRALEELEAYLRSELGVEPDPGLRELLGEAGGGAPVPAPGSG